MRRLAVGAFAASWALLGLPGTSGPALGLAQPQEGVLLRLASQTPWNSSHRDLDVSVQATNTTAATIQDLSIAVTIFAPAGGRIDYEESLTQDPAVPIDFDLVDLRGILRPGQTRTFRVHRHLGTLASRDESALYPMKLELRSADVAVAAIRSPIVFVLGRPKVPLNVTTTFVLADRLRAAPDGTFVDAGLEQAVAPGGSLAAYVAALSRSDEAETDLAVSPLLIEQLERMTRGYRVREATGVRVVPRGVDGSGDAAQLLRALGGVAQRPGTELVAYPFGAPSLPALVRSGLGPDLAVQLQEGAAAIRRSLGTPPADGVLRPPFGLVDGPSLSAVAGQGLGTVLLDAGDAVPAEQSLGFSPAAGGILTSGSTSTGVRGLLPSASLQSLLGRFPDDPRLRAQAALGELAAIYFEQPGVSRGVAMMFDERSRPDQAFLDQLLGGLASTSLVRPVRATRMLRDIQPASSLPLVPRGTPSFSVAYLDGIAGARRAIAQFRSVVVPDTSLPSTLEGNILFAEGAQFLRAEGAGIAYLRRVTDRVHDELRQILPPRTGETFTLASRNGQVPVTIRNLTGLHVRVRVTLRSPSLRFVQGGSRMLDLPGSNQTLFFNVQATRTGRFPVDVLVSTPDGSETVAESQIIVRSTAYNRVALIITIGAALFLLFRWGRRFVRRPTS